MKNKPLQSLIKPGKEPVFHPLSILRVALGLLFFYSGFSKLIVPYQNFMYVIEGYQMLDHSVAMWVARTMPWVEVIGGLFLAAGLWTRAAAGVLWFLNWTFLVALGQALVRRLPIDDCGCFGEGIKLPLWATFAVDCVLWVLFSQLIRRHKNASRPGLDAWLAPREPRRG